MALSVSALKCKWVKEVYLINLILLQIGASKTNNVETNSQMNVVCYNEFWLLKRFVLYFTPLLKCFSCFLKLLTVIVLIYILKLTQTKPWMFIFKQQYTLIYSTHL